MPYLFFVKYAVGALSTECTRKIYMFAWNNAISVVYIYPIGNKAIILHYWRPSYAKDGSFPRIVWLYVFKQLFDFVCDIEAPKCIKAPFRSYLYENCRAYNFKDSFCYLKYDNAIGESWKYYSNEVCTHPKTYMLVFEESDERGIEIKIHAQQVSQLKKQRR